MLYIIATSHQAATDFCRDVHIDPHSKFVRIITREQHAHGIRLREHDGYEIITRPGDRHDPNLFEYWYHVVKTREV